MKHALTQSMVAVLIALLMLLLLGSIAGSSISFASVAPQVASTTPRSESFAPLSNSNALTVALAADVSSLDPALALDADSLLVTSQIYETLATYDPNGSVPVPSLAESWTTTDGRIWLFTLRPNLKFHDNTNLDAAAVVYNFQRWWDPAHPQHNGTFDYFQIAFGGFRGDPNCLLTNVEALDARRVRFTLARVHSGLPGMLGVPAFAIASPTALQAGTLETNPIGSGPFKFDQRAMGDSIHLVANPAYWGEAPQLGMLNFKVIADDASRLTALQNNSVQVASDLDASYAVTATADANLRVMWRPSLNTSYLGINRGHGALSHILVREAIAAAINRTALVDNYFAPGTAYTRDFVSPGIWGYGPSAGAYPYDPQQARDLLTLAGYPNGFTTTLGYRNVPRPYLPDPAGAAAAIQADLQAVGITVTVIDYESGIFLNKVRDGSLDLFLLGWIADHPHPDNFLTPHFCAPGAYGSLGPVDTTLCNMIASARADLKFASQLAKYQAISDYLRRETPVLPLAHGQTALVARREVAGLVPSPSSMEDYRAAYVAPPDLIEAVGADAFGLDPHIDYEATGMHVASQIYESLVTYNRDKSDELVPLLATGWSVSPDRTVYTFTIRPGVRFHNGAALSAEDVAFSLWRGIFAGGSGSPQWMINQALFDVNDVTELVAPDGSLIDDRTALNEQPAALLQAACYTVTHAITFNENAGTVTFHLPRPHSPFLYAIATPWGAVLDKDWLIAHGGWNGSCDTWALSYNTRNENSPLSNLTNGTGPFQLDYWLPNDEIVLNRNPDYWRQVPMWPGGPIGPALLDRVEIRVITDTQTRHDLLLAGSIDFADVFGTEGDLHDDVLLSYDQPDGRVGTLVNPTGTLNAYLEVLDPLGQDAFFTYDIASDSPYIGSGALDGNGIPTDFFTDLHVRKAFNYAFDWDQFNTDVFDGNALRRRGPFIKGILGYTDTQSTYFYSPTLALQEFQQAWGGQVLQQGLVMTIPTNEGNYRRQRFAEIMKAGLESITPTFHVNVITLTLTDYWNQERVAHRLPVFQGGWIQDIPHPYNWAAPYLLGSWYSDNQRLPDAARADFQAKTDLCLTLSGAAERSCWEGIQQTTYVSATDVFLAQSYRTHFVNAEVRGYFANFGLLNQPYLYALSKGPLPTYQTVTTSTQQTINFTSTAGTTAALNVPAGAVTQTTTIVIIPDVPTPDSPGGFQLGNLTFNLQAYVSGTLVPTQTFQQPITITLHYEEQALGLVNEADLLLLWWDGTDWVDAACGPYQRDLINNILTVPICHFSQFTIGGEVSAGLVVDGMTYNDPGDSFNHMAYQGLLRAGSELSLTTQVYTTNGDYQAKLQQCATDGHAVCLGVGFSMGEALLNVATTYSNTKFAVIDVSFDVAPDNVRGIVFAADEAGYLAGVLAGKMTISNKVGVVGGMELPAVVTYVEGYRNGAQCANGQARVLINYAGTFVNPGLGATVAQQMMAQGADVIFGVGGPTGNGAILTATQSGTWAIGVDSDQYVTLFGSGSVAGADNLLSSALKRIDNATFDTIASVISGTFTSGTRTYRLVEDGVGLAPFHGADPSVPQSARDAIDAAKQGLSSGAIDVHDDCRTPLYLPLIRK